MISVEKKLTGFTLIEIIIYVALVGTVLLGLVYFLIGVSQTKTKALVISETQSSQRLIFNQMRRVIKSSMSIDWSRSVLNSHPGKLVLNDYAGQTETIRIDNNNLVLEIGEQSFWLSSTPIKVTQLIFKQLDDQTVSIDLVLNFGEQSSENILNYSTAWHSAIRLNN